MQLCEEGSFHERACLSSAGKESHFRYMIGLGVGMLRAKRYDEAADCFSAALALPGGAGDAATLENLQATRRVLSQQDEEQARRLLLRPKPRRASHRASRCRGCERGTAGPRWNTTYTASHTQRSSPSSSPWRRAWTFCRGPSCWWPGARRFCWLRTATGGR